MKQIHVVGAIIIEKEKILCAKRGTDKSLPGLWEFPGGKIEKNETPQQALVRELEEELLIKVSVKGKQYEHTIYEYDFGTVHLTTFICLLQKGTPKLTEHIEVRWLKPFELDSLEWAPADIPSVKKVMSEGIVS